MTSRRTALTWRFILVVGAAVALSAASLYSQGWHLRAELLGLATWSEGASYTCLVARGLGLFVPDDCADRLTPD